MRFLSKLLAMVLLSAGLASADPLGSAFTYQGQLDDNGTPANGNFDFEFALYSSASGGTAIDTIDLDDQAVSAGLINVRRTADALCRQGTRLAAEALGPLRRGPCSAPRRQYAIGLQLGTQKGLTPPRTGGRHRGTQVHRQEGSAAAPGHRLPPQATEDGQTKASSPRQESHATSASTVRRHSFNR